MGLRASTLGIAGLVVAACASLPPEREAERRLMLDAAHECRIQHPVIRQVEIDSFETAVKRIAVKKPGSYTCDFSLRRLR